MGRRLRFFARWGIGILCFCAWLGDALGIPRILADRASISNGVRSTARIRRDEYGRPSIEAENEYDLFEAYGYAVAQDRLWQLEVFRRAARGRLAEVLGNIVTSVEVKGTIELVELDIEQRQHGYTEQEYQAMYEAMPDSMRQAIAAYRDGINRYLEEARADPLRKLPWEFHVLGYFPEPWTVTDSIAICRLAARIFGERGGRELRNLVLYQQLVKRHGEELGGEIFDDLRWLNDPEAPVTVPLEDDAARAQATLEVAMRDPARRGGPLFALYRWLPDFRAFLAISEQWQKRRRALFQLLGLPVTFGSFGFVIDGTKSRTGRPLLLGGPQMGFLYPDIVHEVHLRAPGWRVTGMAFAGGPVILIGHNERIAWTTTSGPGDNADLYIERLNPVNRDEYLYRGTYRRMEVREEVIAVRTSPLGFPLRTTKAKTILVRRTVHGPVLFVDEANHLAVTLKRAHWMKETETWVGFWEINRARDMADFERAIRRIPTSHHFLYADVEGNIAYWLAGWVPIRPAGYDPRLPLPGTGEAEWEANVRPLPHVRNPQQGWLANWNNKPTVDFDNPDDVLFGKQHRVLRIMSVLDEPTRVLRQRREEGSRTRLGIEDLIEIEKDIARFDDMGPKMEFLREYLLRAVEEVGTDDPRVRLVAQLLQNWDGALYADAIASPAVEGANVIFDVLLQRLVRNIFADELGSDFLSEVSINTVLRILERARAGVPLTYDYFNGRDWRDVIVMSIRETVEELMHTYGLMWAMPVVPREMIRFRHLFGFYVGPAIPAGNRATYTQIVELTDPPRGWNRLPSGQRAFLRPNRFFRWLPSIESALYNQRALFREFGMKPMPF
ncbi:MAG: penicillin acylase family protein [Blastocatellia bacterium]|nr:penicillin acylase family protein [Blastocatellia bacterium]MCS7157977.1 penicillin acylase family protein [Blastocatellia bacterium]MCX7752484.1 penicillin acylase family protein [Blastocatellia bacterium]MDW8167401.1 penicillin acylase family protein [Acidobacteriota bacterium]MDW8257421.1 penicillin acylase family protein [Acidobacteriota bacterium]